MSEYLVYATGSAHPVENATLSFLVTANAEPLVHWYIWGLLTGVLLCLGVITLYNMLYDLSSRLTGKGGVQDQVINNK